MRTPVSEWFGILCGLVVQCLVVVILLALAAPSGPAAMFKVLLVAIGISIVGAFLPVGRHG